MLQPMWPLGDPRWGGVALISFLFGWLSGKTIPPQIDNALSWATIVSFIVAGLLVIGLVLLPKLINIPSVLFGR